MTESEYDTILAALDRQPKMFHPIHANERETWFPSNKAARLMAIITNACEDISCVIEIRKGEESEYKNKLLLKYMLIELRSVVDLLTELEKVVNRVIKGDKNAPAGYIAEEKATTVKSCFAKYKERKEPLSEKLNLIRNKIGAHRDKAYWRRSGELWEILEPDVFSPLFVAVWELHKELRTLDIYDWTMLHEDGAIQILQCGQSHPDRQAEMNAAFGSASE